MTLYAGAKAPGADEENDWLPAPNGPFSLYIRAYWADKAILDATWMPPDVQRFDAASRALQCRLPTSPLFCVLSGSICLRQLLLVLRRQRRRFNRDRQLVQLAGERERDLIIAIVDRRAGL